MNPDDLADLLEQSRQPREGYRIADVGELTVADRLDWDEDSLFGRSP